MQFVSRSLGAPSVRSRRQHDISIYSSKKRLITISCVVFLLSTMMHKKWDDLKRKLIEAETRVTSLTTEINNLNEQYSSRYPQSEDDILSAVAKTRCLTTPGCYPRVPCADNNQKPMKIPVSHKWEEHSFCVHDLLSSREGSGETSPCLIYSFGLNDSIEWETKMADQFGCEVYGFDPTSKFDPNPAKGVKFYQLGLQGIGADVSATHAINYKAIDKSKVRTLGEIIEILGHQNRDIDVLRLDCEGCEYGVLNQLVCSGDSQFVKQLMIEFHWQKRLGIMNDEDLVIGADAIQCLERERWGLVSREHANVGVRNAQYLNSALRVVKDPLYLLFATFRRLPTTELMPWEVLSEVVGAIGDKETYELKKKQYFSLYGQDVEYETYERYEKDVIY